MSITQQTPGAGASLILRGRWSATVDQVDAGSVGHLRSLVQVLRDAHQTRRPAAGPLDLERQLSMDSFSRLDSETVNQLLRALEHKVENGSLILVTNTDVKRFFRLLSFNNVAL